MKKRPQENDQNSTKIMGILPLDGAFLDGIHALSAGKALEKVLNHPDSLRLIQTMSSEDLYFLIHKIGVDESLELLKLATLDQWQYMLDVETWRGDRLELDRAGQWINRLLTADPERLTKWLFSGGQRLAYYFLYRSIAVEVRDEDQEIHDVGPEFFTVDDFFYIRPLNENQREIIEKLIRSMAREDTPKYQAVLSGLAGVLPAEFEEEMYRLKNVRLAEHGFLPREEALAVYAQLKPERLQMKRRETDAGLNVSPKDVGSVPRWPLQSIQDRNLLAKTVAHLTDEALLDRIRLEFAGLCNQILSAEGLSTWDMDRLQEIQIQAAGYLNLILKERCLNERGKEDIKTAEDLLRMNDLLSLFRAGFGLALSLKWRAQRWVKRSWFQKADLEPSFWGEAWGGLLTGLLKRRPLFYCGEESESGFRDFQLLSDLSSAENALGFMDVLDRLIGDLAKKYPLNSPDSGSFPLTFYQLLFTLWARQLLDLNPGFTPLSLKEGRAFLSLLRKGDTAPPYRMFGFEERFLKTFYAQASDFADKSSENLKGALTQAWQDFSNEMEFVPLEAFDAKYSKFLSIMPG
ncbi:MAG: cytochrome P450 [Deltaproteobacteria bacterium]|nr:cytochrome P450 [Deltaproteobacteria bacterium]